MSTACKKLLVLGGNGYVGGSVCRAALAMGHKVVSFNRSGAPKNFSAADTDWLLRVQWEKGSVFDLVALRKTISEGKFDGVVSCIGTLFGNETTLQEVNGNATILACRVAAEEAVERFVFVSAADMGLPSWFLEGYFSGKRRAEEFVHDKFPRKSAVLRPSFIYGRRQVGKVGIPLDLVGKPLNTLTSLPFVQSLRSTVLKPFVFPPVSLEAVGKCAASTATDNKLNGTIEVDLIKTFE